MQSITRRAIARIYFTQDLAETMPFSNGRWDVVHAALSIQVHFSSLFITFHHTILHVFCLFDV
jgi:hypothetical protein